MKNEKKKKNEMENKVVVVTGGSQGIGMCMATEFAKLKAKVIISSRTKASSSVIGVCGVLSNTHFTALTKSRPASIHRPKRSTVSGSPRAIKYLRLAILRFK